MLGLIPTPVLIGVAGAVIAAAGTAYVLHGRSEYQRGAAEVTTQWRAANERTAVVAEEAKRVADTETARRMAAQKEISDAAMDSLVRVRADAASVGDGAVRLRQQLAAVTAADRRRPGCADPAAAAGGASGPAAIDLCADVLGHALSRAESLALVADESRVAGLACEAAYQTLTEDHP